MKQEHFIFKEKGLYWIERMPDKPDFKKLKKDPVYQDYKFFSGYSDRDVLKQYEEALQSAIESAIPVENQEAVLYELYVAFSKADKNGVSYFDWHQGILKEGNVYTLECSVEKKEVDTVEDGGGCYVAGSKTVALVTFPENKREEENLTTEELEALKTIGVIAENWHAVSYNENSMPYALFQNKEYAVAYRDTFSATSIITPWPMIVKDYRKSNRRIS
jgi:hypothetical protein